jgi:hypothetical protein
MSKLLKYGTSILFVLMPTLGNAQNTISQLAERILPAIVVVNTATGNGSGVIVDDSGVIATNYHVIEDSSNVSIELQNGDVYQNIGVISVDQIKDIALLKIDGFDLPTVEFGNSNNVAVGEDVLVMGAPRGMEQTVSRGIVSAIRDPGEGYRLIQTDAAISPGSSGGGMFNLEGELVGLTVSYLEDAQNINFVIPINYVRGMFSTQTQYPLSDLAQNIGVGNGNTSSGSSFTELDDLMSAINERVEGAFEKKGDNWYLVDDSYLLWARVISENIVFTQLYDNEVQVELTSNIYQQILDANYTFNFGKIAIDSDNDLVVTNEISQQNLNIDAYLEVLAGIRGLHEKLVEIVKGNVANQDNMRKPALNHRPKLNESNSYFNDNLFRIAFDRTEWVVQPENFIEEAELSLIFNNDTFLSVVPESGELSYNYMKEFITDSIEGTITESGFRLVNESDMLWLQGEATYEGVKFTYLYHVYTGVQGTIQIVAWTTSNIFERRTSDIEDFVSGFYAN